MSAISKTGCRFLERTQANWQGEEIEVTKTSHQTLCCSYESNQTKYQPDRYTGDHRLLIWIKNSHPHRQHPALHKSVHFFMHHSYTDTHVSMLLIWIKTTKNSNNNNHIQRRNLRFFAISSLSCELSPTRALKWPRRNRANLVQHIKRLSHATCRVTCHLVRKDSSDIKFDKVEIAFIWALFHLLNH